MGNGEIKVYDDYGRIYMHTNLDNETRTYRPDGKMQSIRWADGAVWYYKYDEKGNVVEVESYNMSANSRRPPSEPGRDGEVARVRTAELGNRMREGVYHGEGRRMVSTDGYNCT